jgi:uncharacterized membrane protein
MMLTGLPGFGADLGFALAADFGESAFGAGFWGEGGFLTGFLGTGAAVFTAFFGAADFFLTALFSIMLTFFHNFEINANIFRFHSEKSEILCPPGPYFC